MKAFKILLYTFLFIVLILIVAGAIFVLRFDINQYKDEIAELASQKMGFPIRMGSLAIGFKDGLAITVSDPSVEGQLKTGTGSFSLTAQELSLKLDLNALFRRELLMSKIYLAKPRLVFQSNPSMPASGANATGAPSPFPLPLVNGERRGEEDEHGFFRISRFEVSKASVSNGVFLYQGMDSREPVTFELQNINLELNDISRERPVSFSGTASFFFGGPREFSVEGTFSYVEQQLRLKAHLDREIVLSGEATQLLSVPSARLDVGIQNLELDSFYTPTQKTGEYFSGVLSGNASFTVSSLNAAQLTSTMAGAGEFQIANGALKNRNLIRENFEKITQIPGISLLFQVDLGPRFDALLKSPDTVFELLKAQYQIANGQVNVRSLTLQHPDYAIGLSGFCSFDRLVDLNGSLLIANPIAEMMVKKVHELSLIVNPNGEIVIPFAIRGRLPNAEVKPDLGGLVQRTVQTIGEDLLNQAINSFLKPKKEEQVQQ